MKLVKVMIRYSVIIPAYQAEKTIKLCLKTLFKSVRSDFEVIVVNDCSTDKTDRILRDISDSRLKLVTLMKNSGVSQARNYGIRTATGEYISFVDSDDYVPENYFEILDSAVKDDVDIAIFNYNIIQEQNVKHLKNTNYQKNILLSPQKVYETMCIECSEGPWNKIYKKRIIDDNKIYFEPNIKMWEDLLFFAKAVRFSKTIKAYEKSVYYYKHSDSGITAQSPNKYVTDFIVLNESMMSYLNDYNISLSRLVDYSVQWLYMNLINNTFEINSIVNLSKANIIHKILKKSPTNMKIKVKQYLIRIFLLKYKKGGR